MKRNIFLTVLLIIFVCTAAFGQTAVRVPDFFVGVWWADLSDEVGIPGVQFLVSVEIKRDGVWISSFKVVGYTQQGREFLEELGLSDGMEEIAETGVISKASSTEIEFSRDGESDVHDKFIIEGNGIIDMFGNRWSKEQPRPLRG